MSDPRLQTNDILSSNVWRRAQVSAKAKLNKTINLVLTWPPVYTPMIYDISHVIFSSLEFVSNIFAVEFRIV